MTGLYVLLLKGELFAHRIGTGDLRSVEHELMAFWPDTGVPAKVADKSLRLDEAAREPDGQTAARRLRLERVRRKVGDDGVERIATQALFDIIEVPLRSPSAAARWASTAPT